MIKLTYKGFLTEVDSAEEARKIINEELVVPRVALKPVVPQKARRKQSSLWKHWNENEIKAIFTALDNNATPVQISNYKPLRDVHSRIAIRMMIQKILRNETKYVSTLVGDLIKEYHQNKPRTLIPTQG
jgi:hypothetical protein